MYRDGDGKRSHEGDDRHVYHARYLHVPGVRVLAVVINARERERDEANGKAAQQYAGRAVRQRDDIQHMADGKVCSPRGEELRLLIHAYKAQRKQLIAEQTEDESCRNKPRPRWGGTAGAEHAPYVRVGAQQPEHDEAQPCRTLVGEGSAVVLPLAEYKIDTPGHCAQRCQHDRDEPDI